MVQVAIRSKLFGTYISLNGTGITHYRGYQYKGTVKTVEHVRSWETFKLHCNDNGTVSFESSIFPNVFLSLDGKDIQPGVITGPGGGSVAAEYKNQEWEKFNIHRHGGGATVAIESEIFPRRYLRVNGRTNEVNVQGGALSYEQFEIVVVG